MGSRRIRILVNPSAHSGRVRRALDRAGLLHVEVAGASIEWVESTSAVHFIELVRDSQREPLDAIGLAGGDGTVAMALAALDGVNRVPFGVLPVGSGNDFARDAGVPTALPEAFRVLVEGEPCALDTARVIGGARYCCVASVGLDEIALPIIHASPFPRSKALNVYAALRALVSYRPRALRVTWEGGAFEGEAMFAAVTNTRSYGGGFRVSPRARLDDGQLDLCIVRRAGALKLLGSFPRILRGTHDVLPEVVMARSPWVRIVGDAVPVALDGELPSLRTPVELRCEPASVRVLAPRDLAKADHIDARRVA